MKFAVKADDETGELVIGIPEETLKLLGWEEGDIIAYSLDNGCIHMRKHTEAFHDG